MTLRKPKKVEDYTEIYYKLKSIRDFSNSIQNLYGRDDLMFQLSKDTQEYMTTIRNMLAKDLN